MTRQVQPGVVYCIPDPDGGFYYGVIGQGLDVLLLDTCSDEPVDLAQLSDVPHFLRIAVVLPSIRRAGWKPIGRVPEHGPVGEYGKYRHVPAGSSIVYLYDNLDGFSRASTEQEVAGVEDAGAWDAAHHVLPILRYHFRRVPTPLLAMVRGAI